MNRRSAIAFLVGLALALVAGFRLFPTVLYARSEQPLQFNHKLHTSEPTSLTCADCHTLREDGSFAGIPTIESCAGCHAEPVGQSAGEKTLIEEYLKPGREIPWRVYARQPENVHFPHAQHTKRAQIPCERCHGPHGGSTALRPFEENRISGYSRDIWGPSMARLDLADWQGMKMTDCERCHRQSKTTNQCLPCHK